AVDQAADRAGARAAVDDAVRRQVEAGIDVVSDGEMAKPGFANYVRTRMTGFGGQSRPMTMRDVADYPEVAARVWPDQPSVRAVRPANDGPVAYVGRAELEADLADLRSALD